MQKLNKNGRILLQYREEFLKHHSDSVDAALKSAILSLYESKKIDERVFRAILDESITTDEVEIILTKKNDFTKNAAELGSEFDQIRKNVNEYMISTGFVNNMTTKNAIELNKISIIRQFDLSREFLIEYFGLNNSEIISLMRRRGFMEKFAVLRLNEVMRQVFKELRVPEDIDHGYSLVYYNKNTKSFSIDYKYHINIDLIKNIDRMKIIIDKIKELDKVVERKFLQKLGCPNLIKTNTLSKQNKGFDRTEMKQQTTIKSPDVVIAAAKPSQTLTIVVGDSKPKSESTKPNHPQPPIPKASLSQAAVNTETEKTTPSSKIELPPNIPQKKPQAQTPSSPVPVPTSVVQTNKSSKSGPEIITTPAPPQIIVPSVEKNPETSKSANNPKDQIPEKTLDVLFNVDEEEEDFL